MAEERKSEQNSVLFTLRELLDLEQQRVNTEQQAAIEKKQQLARSKMEAELKLRAAEEARMRAESERREILAARAREEEARLVAVREAEVERVRLATAHEANQQTMVLQQQHERELRVIESNNEKRRLRRAVIGLVVGTLAIAGLVVGYLFGVVFPEQQRLADVAQQELQETRAKNEAIARENEARAGKIKDLETRIASETDANKKLQLERDLALLNTPTGKPVVKPQGGPLPVPTATATATAKRPCNPLDPMDPCD